MSKGEETRGRIVDRALRLASKDGFEGLTIGSLADDLGLSKSGLFAHFGSKDELQLQVLEAAIDRFRRDVVRPALSVPRGEPRLRAFFENWLAWGNDRSMPGGCVIIAAATEFDDRPGPQRDFIAAAQREWLAALAKAVRLAIDEGHFHRGVDPRQFAFDMWAGMLGYHHVKRLLREPEAEAWVRNGFDRLVQQARPTSDSANRRAPSTHRSRSTAGAHRPRA